MINKEELLFAVDENNNPIEPISREKAHKNGIWHRISDIWIINKKKQVLVQKRSALKDTNPGKWEAFVGGHVAAYEEYIDNAVKELKEELDLLIDKNQLHFVTINKDEPTKHFKGVFYTKWEDDSKEIILEKEEIDDIKWIAISDLSHLLLTQKHPDWVHVDYEKDMLDRLKIE